MASQTAEKKAKAKAESEEKAAAEKARAEGADAAAHEAAAEAKGRGNELFKLAHYAEAAEAYSEGIDLCPTAVLYSNRSFAYLRSESFGLALADAELAIGLDARYAKGYFRKASALMVMGKVKEAVKMFRKVCTLKPKDKLARKRYKEAERCVGGGLGGGGEGGGERG